MRARALVFLSHWTLDGLKPLEKRGGSAYLPEPKDDRVVVAVAILVLGVLSPVVHVHISQTAHQQL